MNSPHQPTIVCQICYCRLDEEQAAQHCPECRTPYHAPCWEELGGCAVFGCPLMVEVKKAENETVTIWGEQEKTCPVCAEKIAAEALHCPLCRAAFDDVRPVAREELLRPPEDAEQAGYRKKAIWLLVFSLLGCTSPLALIVGSLWYYKNQQELARAGAEAKGLTIIALVVAAVYLVLAALGLLIFSVKGGQNV